MKCRDCYYWFRDYEFDGFDEYPISLCTSTKRKKDLGFKHPINDSLKIEEDDKPCVHFKKM